MKKLTRVLAALLVLCMVLSLLPTVFAEENKSNFAFLVTSDLHGQIFATDYTVDASQSGTYKRGLTRISSYIKEMRQEYGDNLYVADMGDTIQGAPLTYYYAFNKPEADPPAIKAFRTIGYDMWVVGNHEFNYGLNILNRQLDYATSPSTETEKQLTVSMANYLDAATNSDESKDWKTWKGYEPYVIKDFDGVKVAIIGFGNPNIPTWDIPANWEGIYFANIIDTYKHYEPEMKAKADMIVVVAHSGVNSDEKSDYIERLIQETDSIAFAFSGHEHNNKDWTIKNAKGEDVHVLQPFTKARAIAQVKVSYDKATGKADIDTSLVDMENYKLDEDLVKVLQPYEDTTWKEYMLEKIGEADGDFTAAELGTKPSAFMDLVNTVQLWGAYDNTGKNTPDDPTDDKPAQLSISAPLTSGDNANIIDKGNIYLGDMFKLYRFENWFYQITMKGEEVRQWLEFAATKIRTDSEGKPYVTNGDLTYYDVIYGDGFSYVLDYTKPEGSRVVSMTYNGKAVAADQTFTVVVNNYRYNGGGHYIEWLNSHGCSFTPNDPDRVIYSTQFDMIQGEDKGQARNLLTDYIREKGTITPTITSTWSVEKTSGTTYELVADSNNMLKYGHLDLNVSTEEFLKHFSYGDIVTVSFLDKSYDFPVCSNYDDVDTHELLIRAATGKNVVTLAINYGQIGVEAGIIEKAPDDSATKYRVKDGVTFPITATVTMKEAGGYSDELSVRQLNRTNNREEYPELTDAQFANFRNISTTGMGAGILYRSSSPINPELGRNTYADKAAEAAGVKTFVNLADSEEEAKGYEGFSESYYSKQNVVFLNLPVAFTTDEFKNGLAEGFRFITKNEGPYLVHCTEGKDRAGLTSAILECFMGASAEEVSNDYLTTFRNYYNVVDGKQAALTEAQETYLRNAILKNLCLIFNMEDATKADLAKEAEEYMKEIGLTDAEIAKLRENLSKSVAVSVKTTAPATAEIDKYGDVRLSITSGELLAAGFDYADYVTVEFLDQKLTLPVIPEYRYVGAREAGVVAWKDASKPVELEVFNGSFAANYGLATKTTNPDKSYVWNANEGVTFPVEITITMAEKGGYKDQYEVYDLVRTNDRADYPDLTDEQFANFRMVSTTGVGYGVLYRSSSPVNPEIGRNTYADAAAKAHGVKTIMNLADNQAKAEAYEGYADTYYSKQNVVFLGIGVDFLSETNRTGLAEGLRYFATHEGPYLVHCNEGQDRAGFTSALLECLMGASLDEVKADYATTYMNYYGVKLGTTQYATISNNIVKNLKTVFGVETLEGADLAELAETYVKGLGLTDDEIAQLRKNLGRKNPFEDVSEKDWFYDYVLDMTERGVINGVSPTEFEPQENLTRAHLVTMVYRLAGEPTVEATTSKFTDVKADSYYFKAAVWAEQEGIINGTTETTFEPDAYVTREQMVTILYRFVNAEGDFAAKADAYKDAADIYGYAKNAVGWATENGLVAGYPDGTFQPKGTATRAEAAKVLSLFAEIIGR